MMSDIKRMTAYLKEAELWVDNVYQLAAEEKGSTADLLRKNMNHIAMVLSESRQLLDGMKNERTN